MHYTQTCVFAFVMLRWFGTKQKRLVMSSKDDITAASKGAGLRKEILPLSLRKTM